MRWLVVVVLVGGTAYADPPSEVPSTAPPMYTHQRADNQTSGMFIDFGLGEARIADEGFIFHADTVSFSPHATFAHNFYFGPELYVGSFDQTSMSDLAALGSGANVPTHISGHLLGVNVVLGARMRFASILSGALEAAAGFRYSAIHDDTFDLVVVDVNTSGTNRDLDDTLGILELRGRVDAWISPHFSLGAIVAENLTDTSNMSVALRLGVHFEPYDHSR